MPLNSANTRICIAGLGLLGASLGLALAGSSFKRIGWARKKECLEKALKRNVVDEFYPDLKEAVSNADLTIFCLPIPQIIEHVLYCADSFKKGSIVSDVGSVKSVICKALSEPLAKRNVEFLGAHPMAGTEKNGIDAAFPELYRNANIFLTASDSNTEKALSLLTDVWQKAGARIINISPDKHDQLVAYTSHLTHLTANALTNAVLGSTDQEDRTIRYNGCAGGFRDSTRIASSPAPMWRAIIENNRPAILKAIAAMEAELDSFRQSIENSDFGKVEEKLNSARILRDGWLTYKEKQH